MVSGPQIDSKMAPRRPREVPGEPRGSLASPGLSREGPGEPFGHPRAPPGEPFGLHFWCLLGYVFPINFEVTFLRILGRILAPFGYHFGSQNRPRSPLGAKRSIFKNPCFTSVKPYFSSLEAPRSSQNRSRKRLENSIRFLTEFCAQNDSEMTPKSIPKGAQRVPKSLRKSI